MPPLLFPTAGGGGGSGGGSQPLARLSQEQLREIFEFYCNFGRTAIMTYQDSLDSFMFMKFARECPDLMDRRLNATGASGLTINSGHRARARVAALLPAAAAAAPPSRPSQRWT